MSTPSTGPRATPSWCVATFVLSLGCVDVPHPFARPARPSVERMREREWASERARRARLPRIADAPPESRWIAVDGERRYVIAGPLRLEVVGGEVRAADDVTPSPIERAFHATRGWLFYTQRGEVYASPTFTGRLRALGALDCPDRDAGWTLDGLRATTPSLRLSDGRDVFEARRGGGLHWSDGAALHHVDDPGVAAMAWHGDHLGAEIVRYRTIRVTNDGGRTWRDAELGGTLPLALAGTPGGLFAFTTAGWQRLDEQARLTAGEPPLPARPGAAVRDARTTAAIVSALGDGYDIAAAPPSNCERPDPNLAAVRSPLANLLPMAGLLRTNEPPSGWTSPSFIVALPSRTEPGMPDGPSWVIEPVGRRALLASADDLRRVAQEAAATVIAATNPEPGVTPSLAWRSEDARGAFTTRAPAHALRDFAEAPSWALVAATRTGALLEAFDPEDGPVGPATRALFWFTAAGERRVDFETTGRLSSLYGLPLDDGGVVVLGAEEFPHAAWAGVPPVAIAFRVAPDGSVVGLRRTVSHERAGEVVGLGESGGAWGIAAVDRKRFELTLLPLTGGEQPFGRWALADPPDVCGAAGGAPARLHMFGGTNLGYFDFVQAAARISPQADSPDFADTRRVTFERAGASGAACVRAVWGGRRVASPVRDEDGDARRVWGALHLTARNGRLVGTQDDGFRIATVTATVEPRSPFASPDDY